MQSATFLTRSFFDASHIAPFPDLACFHRFELFLQIQARPLNETGTPLDGVARIVIGVARRRTRFIYVENFRRYRGVELIGN